MAYIVPFRTSLLLSHGTVHHLSSAAVIESLLITHLMLVHISLLNLMNEPLFNYLVAK